MVMEERTPHPDLHILHPQLLHICKLCMDALCHKTTQTSTGASTEESTKARYRTIHGTPADALRLECNLPTFQPRREEWLQNPGRKLSDSQLTIQDTKPSQVLNQRDLIGKIGAQWPILYSPCFYLITCLQGRR